MTSASDDKACVSKFNQVENDLQNYINAQLMALIYLTHPSANRT